MRYLLVQYATNDIIGDAYTDVLPTLQSSVMSERNLVEKLWKKAFRCRDVFSDNRLKSLFADGLLPPTRPQVPPPGTTV